MKAWLNYKEDSLIAKRYRLLNEEFEKNGSVVLEKKHYKYSLTKTKDGFILDICTPKLAGGGQVYHTLTELEVDTYFIDGITSLYKRMDDMKENIRNYEYHYWK